MFQIVRIRCIGSGSYGYAGRRLPRYANIIRGCLDNNTLNIKLFYDNTPCASTRYETEASCTHTKRYGSDEHVAKMIIYLTNLVYFQY